MNALRLGIVTFGFLGCSPVAPGTFGTLGAVALALLLRHTENYLLWTLAICAVLYAAGRALAPWSEARARGKDPSFFVLDEVIGYLLTIAWITGPSYLALAVGFVLFRFFDVLKPPPLRRLEAIRGGDGILLDDVGAGLYAFALLSAARFLLPAAGNWTV